MTLIALVIMLVVTTIGTLLLTSLLGEFQGAFLYRHAASAFVVAEAGEHWAVNQMSGAGATTYAGDAGQPVQGAGGQQVGVFDVNVTCQDGSAVSTGCAAQPNQRVVTSTGYAPSKTSTQGQRTVRAVAQLSFLGLGYAMCGYNSVTIQPNMTVYGNVGSEGAGSPDLTIGSGSSVMAGGGQPGNVYTITSPNCGACSQQVAGTVFANQPPGTVCPSKSAVTSSFSCAPGTANWPGGDLTINSTNNSWSALTFSQNTLTFDTTGLSGPLVVQVDTITFNGQPNYVVIKGSGTVNLIVNTQLVFGPAGTFGQDYSTGGLVPANRLVVESCGTGTISAANPAIKFQPGNQLVSGVFIAPNGDVMNSPATGSLTSILANNIKIQPGSSVTYDPSAQSLQIPSGLPKILSWQDVP